MFFFQLKIGSSSSFNALMSSVQQKMLNLPRNAVFLDDQKLELVPGQRGKQLLLLDGYTFATNLVVEKSTYWCCRHRTVNQPPCRARARTINKDNGLYTIIISQPTHNHKPPTRTFKKAHETLDQ